MLMASGCGIDEAGRGPLAGPVVAACVHIAPDVLSLPFWADVNDSKKLTPRKRADLARHIRENSTYGIAEATVDEIDGLNIHQATLLAMRRAYESLPANIDIEGSVLIDGKFTPALPVPATAVIGGDGLHLCIAAASILAKVTRDGIMASLHEQFPAYGWAHNAGYGTKDHLESLKTHGPSPHHRRSYAPVKALLLSS